MLTRRIESVRYDEARGSWYVLNDGGTILATGFPSNEEAWRWIDRRDDHDSGIAGQLLNHRGAMS